jgi:hypothetical protein
MRQTPRVFDQEQGFDAAVRVPIVLGGLTGRGRHRDVGEDMDLGAQDGFLERTQSGRREALHPRDEGLHRLALRRSGGGIKRCVGVEIGGERLPRGLLAGRTSETRELSSNELPNRLDIGALFVGSRDASPSFAWQSLEGATAHKDRPICTPRQPAAAARRRPV